MAKLGAYVTTNYVKGLKNDLKNKYNEIFNVQELTKEEDSRYHLYRLNIATSIYEDDKKVLGKDYDDYKFLEGKVNGEITNPQQKINALELVKKAYREHHNHEKPSWWQFGKRYAYWQERKAIESFCDKLIEIGVEKDMIMTAKVGGYLKSDLDVLKNSNNERTVFELDDEYGLVEKTKEVAAFEAVPVAEVSVLPAK